MSDKDATGDDVDGVESGGEWLPPTDSKGKVSKLPLLSDTAAPTAKVEGGWKVDQIRDALVTVSFGADVAMGGRVGAELTMSEKEAGAIAEPLTRIINRRAFLRRAASEGGDPVDVVLVAMASAPYGMRVAGEAIETRRKEAEQRLRELEAEHAAAQPEPYQPATFEVPA